MQSRSDPDPCTVGIGGPEPVGLPADGEDDLAVENTGVGQVLLRASDELGEVVRQRVAVPGPDLEFGAVPEDHGPDPSHFGSKDCRPEGIAGTDLASVRATGGMTGKRLIPTVAVLSVPECPWKA